MLIAHFETLLQLQGKSVVTQDGFTIEDHPIDMEKRKRIDKCIEKLKKLEQTDRTEQNGFNTGVTSVYIPSRVFFGYIPDPSLEQLTYTNPLAVENEINYDEETCGFDECSETDESSEETSESTDFDGKTETQQNNDEEILKQMN